MADGANNRQLTGEQRAAQALVVEARKVLHGAAASRHDHHVNQWMLHHVCQRVDQISRRALALHE